MRILHERNNYGRWWRTRTRFWQPAKTLSVFYASTDVKGFHYDANAIFNEMLEAGVHR
jgi:hypothetical protein